MTLKPTRRIAVIASSDVVGYSRLMSRDETGTFAELSACHQELIEPLIGQFGGRIVKKMGDGLLIEFSSAVDAVLWAIELQTRVANRYSDTASDKVIKLRIGLHLGDIISEADDIFGDGVNLATRLQEVADPGGVSVSNAILDQIAGKIDHSFEDLGFRRLKNLENPVRIHRARLTDQSSERTKPRQWPYVAETPPEKTPEASGGCLCGRVGFDVWNPPAAVGYCHCRMCQLALGGPLNAWAAFKKADVTFSGELPKVFQSSPVARRAFCAECGTSIYTEIEGADGTEFYSIRLATLDNPEDFPPTCHFGVENRIPWLSIEDDLPRIRTEEDAVLSERWAAAGEDKGGPPRRTAAERLRFTQTTVK